MKEQNKNCFFDCHVHSHFSSDSDAQPLSEFQAAAALGLNGLCLTEHNDFGYPPEDGKEMFQLPFSAYLAAVPHLQKQAADCGITLYVGIEQGLQCAWQKEIDSFDPEHQLDFIIGSSHLVDGKDPYYPAFWDDRDVRLSIEAYFQSILDNIISCHNYDVYGHLDYITRYIPAGQNTRPVLSFLNDQKDLLDLILQELLSHGKGLEINTAGFRYSGMPNPAPFLLQRYRELGGEIITIGSDAHKPDQIGSCFNQAQEILISCGFRYFTVFSKRKPQFHRL